MQNDRPRPPREADDSMAGPLSRSQWQRLRTRLRQELRRQVQTDPETLEDLVQEACVRLLRALRQQPQIEPDAYVKVIAHRTGSDHLRGLYRQRRLVEAAQAGAVESALPQHTEPWKGEVLERLEFLICELFEQSGDSECKELSRAWFEERNWREIAEQSGAEHATVRKRWSRCLKKAQERLAADGAWSALLSWSVRT
jgi:RNA polymerase sigma factor (sigma-70 family)